MTMDMLTSGDPVTAANNGGYGSEMLPALTLVNSQKLRQSNKKGIELQVLNEPETRERNECEKIISKGWNTFLEVGRALCRIRQKRLYRDHYSTFEEYCQERWDFSK